jgi:flagellar protein FlgJ
MELTAPLSMPLPQMLSSDPTRATGRDADPRTISKQFEGIFATIMLKQMRQSLENGLFPGDSGDVLGGLFDHYIGEHIANAGGFGVGDMIRHQLERQQERVSLT